MHVVQNLSSFCCVDFIIQLSSPGLTRTQVEVERNIYVTDSMGNTAKGGKGSKGAADPHALYAGGIHPVGAGGGDAGRRQR